MRSEGGKRAIQGELKEDQPWTCKDISSKKISKGAFMEGRRAQPFAIHGKNLVWPGSGMISEWGDETSDGS